MPQIIQLPKLKFFGSESNYLARLLPVLAVFALVGSLFIFRSSAAASSLYLSPDSHDAVVGSAFSVTVRASGSNITKIDAEIRYDTANFEYIAADTAKSAFGDGAGVEAVAGSVRVTQQSDKSRSGDLHIATIQFKPLKAVETADITLKGALTVNGEVVDGLQSVASVRAEQDAEALPARGADTTSPSVQILSPAENSQLDKTTELSAVGFDNDEVSRMEISMDNIVLSSVNSNTISVMYDFGNSKLAKGFHTIEIRAFDRSGNSGSALVHIEK